MEYITIPDEELRKSICEKYLVGKGGNGYVYKIRGTDEYVFKKINLRFNKKGLLHNDNEKKKYARFRDEVSVVLNHQEKISGILPIFQCSEFPDVVTVTKDAFLYYVMPYATCLDKISFGGIKDIVKCFHSLFNTLAVLHDNKIAHRDIKPSNIYEHNSEFKFGDFGLVHFQNKQAISQFEKRIGPWTTIAPEMERYPFEAAPFPADVYSLAKTLWIILTGEPKSFEGQYNYLDTSISLNTNIKNSGNHSYLGILHKLLKQCTSNLPEDRPTAKEVADQLEIWLSHDMEQISKVEWELLLQEIVSSRPKTIVWDDSKEIGRILDVVGKTRGLNHTFFPDGGGQDLHGAKVYSNNKVELDFGYKMVVLPKRLHLNLYEDVQWNHFYLETNEFLLEKDGNGEPYSGIPFDNYLQIDEDTYIERWKANYPEYDGIQIPENAQIVTINHYGNYVIFPKISFYNNFLDKLDFKIDQDTYIFDPYGRLHEKLGTGETFASFIERVKPITIPDGEISIPRDWILKYARNITRSSYDPTLQDRREKMEEKICRCFEAYDFRSLFEDTEPSDAPNSSFEFEIRVWVEATDLYFLNKDYRFVKRRTQFNLSELPEVIQEEQEQAKEVLFINGFDRTVIKIEAIKNAILNLVTDVSEDIINFTIKSRRTSRLALLSVLDKNCIRDVLSRGNDDTGGVLVMAESGELLLVKLEKFSRDFCPYSTRLFEFDPHMNILGNNSGERLDNFIDNYHSEFLSITLEHLQSRKFTDFLADSIDDWESRTIEELSELITLENEKFDNMR